MSAILHGVLDDIIYPQPDFQAKQTEHGGWTGSQSFWIKKGGLDRPAIIAMFPAGTRATALDPNCDAYYQFLRLVSISNVRTIEGGFTAITAEYVGFYTAEYEEGTSDAKTYPTFSLRGGIEEKPFMEHPKWVALTTNEKFALGELISGNVKPNYDWTQVGQYEITEGFSWALSFFPLKSSAGTAITLTANAIEFATRIAQGKTTYKVGSFVWSTRWQGATGLAAATLNDLSRVAVPFGTPPTPNGARDWMLIDANQEQTGIGDFCFTNEVSWLLSDRGGHDSFLQGP